MALVVHVLEHDGLTRADLYGSRFEPILRHMHHDVAVV
jgi:hypothetical protein